jgi:hypothetical protein
MLFLVLDILVITATLVTRFVYLKDEEYKVPVREKKKAPTTVKDVINEHVRTESDQSWDVNGPIPKERAEDEIKSATKKKVDNYPEHPYQHQPTYENAVVREISPNMAKMERSPMKTVSMKTKDYKYSHESFDNNMMSTERGNYDDKEN